MGSWTWAMGGSTFCFYSFSKLTPHGTLCHQYNPFKAHEVKRSLALKPGRGICPGSSPRSSSDVKKKVLRNYGTKPSSRWIIIVPKQNGQNCCFVNIGRSWKCSMYSTYWLIENPKVFFGRNIRILRYYLQFHSKTRQAARKQFWYVTESLLFWTDPWRKSWDCYCL